MLVERRPPIAAPLRDLNLTASLRLRRRHGRIAYLLALFTARRGQPPTAASTNQVHPERATIQAAPTLRS